MKKLLLIKEKEIDNKSKKIDEIGKKNEIKENDLANKEKEIERQKTKNEEEQKNIEVIFKELDCEMKGLKK